MRKRTATKLILLVVGVSLLGLVVMFVREGLGHSIPAAAWRDARLQWESGRTGEALQGFTEALAITLENGARHTIAGPFIDQMHTLRAEGRMNEAYDYCMRAVGILDVWDEGGFVSYDCFSLWIYVNCTEVGDQVICPP